MAIRKIPKNYLFVTGGYSSRKNEAMDGFESLLEKDYLILLDFDETVASFEVQPVRIPVAGVPQGYVPDVLVHHKPDPVSGLVPRPWLVEIKHSTDLMRNAQKYKAKFAAAHQFAQEHGWDFKVLDETNIRTSRLPNIKFLREYRNVHPTTEDIEHVRDCMSIGRTTLQGLLEQLAPTDEEKLYWLPIVWFLVLSRQLSTDWDQELSNDIPLEWAGGRA